MLEIEDCVDALIELEGFGEIAKLFVVMGSPGIELGVGIGVEPSITLDEASSINEENWVVFHSLGRKAICELPIDDSQEVSSRWIDEEIGDTEICVGQVEDA